MEKVNTTCLHSTMSQVLNKSCLCQYMGDIMSLKSYFHIWFRVQIMEVMPLNDRKN